MGEFIIFLAVAAAGFAVGRLTSRRGTRTRAASGHGSGLPHPAQIYQEGYEAGHRDAVLAPHGSGPAGDPAGAAPAGLRPAPGQPLAPPSEGPPGPGRLQGPQSVPLPHGTPGTASGHNPTQFPPLQLPMAPPSPRSPSPHTAEHPAGKTPAHLPVKPGNGGFDPGVPGPGSPRPGNPVLSDPRPEARRPLPPPPAPRTDAEVAEEKRRRDLRNINITLYAGSLLLVAAAALFIGISIPEQARFAGVAVVAALFYASGLVVHTRKKSLRPAAVAFTGTGLALIPVVGLAFYTLIFPDPVLAWLATSLAGTAAFAYAAARLESRVVTYLALTFLLSTALASGAALRSGIVWYFVCTVLLATLLSLAAIRRPGWLRNIYLDAFIASHRFLVPATAAAALLTAPDLGSGPLAVLFLVFAAYYGVMLWQGPKNQVLMHSYGLRAAAAAGLVILTFRATDSWPATLLAAVAVCGVQVGLLFAFRGHYLRAAVQAAHPGAVQPGAPRAGGGHRSGPGGARLYRIDLLGVLGLQFAAGLAAAAAYALSAQPGTGAALLFAAAAAAVQLTHCTAAWRLSNRAEFLAPAGVILPASACLLSGAAELWPVLLNLGLLTGYLVLRAARARGSARAGFVLAARASAAVLLPLSVFALLQDRAPETAVSWSLAAAFLAAAASQAWSVLAAASGRQELFPRTAPAVSAGAALAFAAALRFEDTPVLQLAALWTVVLLNAVYSALPLRRGRGLAAPYAPAGFLAAGVLGAGLLGVRGYALLCTATLAYCVLQAAKPAVPVLRGWYFAAGQVVLAVLAGLVAQDLDLGTHGVFVAVAAALAVQHAARTVLGARLEPFGPVRALGWGNLLVLAATGPAYYLALAGGAEPRTGCVLLLIAVAGAVLTQLASALRSPASGRFSAEPAAAAALVLLLTAGVRAAEGGTGTLTLAALWTAFTANLLTAALHRHSALAFLAPGGFTAAMLLGVPVLGLRGYELLFAAGLAYCTALVLDRSGTLRGIYLAGAQGLGAVLAALLAADVSGGSASVFYAAFFAALGITLAAGHILRTVLHRRVQVLGTAEPVRWGGLAVLALVPVVYSQFGGRSEPAALLITVLSSAGAFAVTGLDAALRSFRKSPLPNAAELILASASAVLLAVPAVRLIDGSYAGWALGLLWTALGVTTAASLLLGPGRWEALAAGGFAGAALAGGGLLGLRGYELLVVAALGYALVLSRFRKAHRGQYLLGAQLLTAVLAVLAAADAGADIHGIIAAGAAACAAVQLVRSFQEPRQPDAWAQAAAWMSMGLLVSAPFFYTVLAGSVRRDVTALLLLLLLAVSTAGYARRTGVPVLYPGLYALGALPLVLSDVLRFGSGGVLPSPLLTAAAAGLVLAGLAAAALAGEARARTLSLRNALLGACVAYAAAVLAAAASAGGNLLLAALAPALLGAAALSVSYTRTNPWLGTGTPPLLLAAALLAAAGFEQEVLSRPFAPGYGLLWPAWGAALALQAIRFLASLRGDASPLRLRIPGAGSSLALLIGAVPAMAEYNGSAVAGAFTLLAALALALRETPRSVRETAAEAACLPAALAVERIAWFGFGGANVFWSVQYWAVVLAGLAAWEFLRRRGERGTILLGASAVILSGSGLGTVLYGGTGEQLWALVAHAGLLVFGLLASRKLFTVWGAAGVALAVLWYLRGYTFLLLALLASGLIALAVWRLSRVRAAAEQETKDILEKR